MKKYLYYLLVVLCCSLFVPTITSCDTDDDNEEFYAGESEADFEPAVYSIFATFEGETAEVFSSEFDTRKLAEVFFDTYVSELKKSTDFEKGDVIKLSLKRGNAIMKSATITF